jgi:hypothetical protein
MATEYINPNNVSKIKTLVANLLCIRFIFNSSIAYFLIMAADILRLQHFLNITFKQNKHVKKREILWDLIIKKINTNASVYEFGVAYGYTTNYFLQRITEPIDYFGFDSFNGLPNSWRNLGQGTFSTGGIPPKIKDNRLKWIVGSIQKTYSTDFDLRNTSQNILLFDFDLYEPTLHAYLISQKLNLFQVGSLLYFDEAYDPAELLIIQNRLLVDYEVELLGSTWGAVAFRIIRLRKS